MKIKLTLPHIKGKEVGSKEDELIINIYNIEGYVESNSRLCKDFRLKKHHREGFISAHNIKNEKINFLKR